jgi:pimeloyl-ACP methyl ester carboxylesterase
MDYNLPLNVSKDNPKVHIALVMIPAPRHIRTGKYSDSPLLINPGGPGGSGAFFALGIGSKLQSIVSSDNSRDIIGFDPRGIGATTPQADCWTDPFPGEDATDEAVRTGAFDQMICTL